jgi:hypothetical protein
MEYKSNIQKEALLKQGKYLQKFNEQTKIFKTEEDVNKAKQLYLSGKTTREIGKIFGCSKVPVERVLKSSGVVFRKPWDSPNHKSKNQYGENNPAWKGGIKNIYDRFRDLSEYYEWRKQVLDRDENKCTSCENINKLHSHHIKTLKTLIWEYSLKVNKLLKDLTREDLTDSYFYDLSNGLTLCETCHKKWHKENGR